MQIKPNHQILHVDELGEFLRKLLLGPIVNTDRLLVPVGVIEEVVGKEVFPAGAVMDPITVATHCCFFFWLCTFREG